MEPIRVLIVDDSPLTCKVLSNVINQDPQLIVAGVAHDGREAVKMVPLLKPDLITMDIRMPGMDGLEATKQIMAHHPTPILVVSSSVIQEGPGLVFKALAYGALDVIEKGPLETHDAHFAEAGTALTERIKMLARIQVITHPLGKFEAPFSRLPAVKVPSGQFREGEEPLVGIVASTGGPQALRTILKAFPKDFPCGVVIVQHIASGFAEGLAEWLSIECPLAVRLATDGARIEPGAAYVAPTGVQMRVGKGGVIQLSDEAPYDGYKPSGNVLLTSVAQVYRDRAVGVILTGMGTDGVLGLQQIKASQGHVIAQDETTSIVFGMPKAAIEAEVAHQVLPVGEIARAVVRVLERLAAKAFR